MMQKYKKIVLFNRALALFRVKKQKKNVTRRKKVALFRLKTLGFGFVSTICFFRQLKLSLKKKSFFFFNFTTGLPRSDLFFKNTVKTALEINAFCYLQQHFFFNVDQFNSYQAYFFLNKLFLNKLFFFKLFFFKLFFFKLFFFKLFLSAQLFLS
jgi:hypothetical protein